MRAEIFRLLFGVDDKELYVREIERQSGLSLGTVRQELKKLREMDLVRSRRSGNRVYYRANDEHPLFHDIRFGSIARSDEGARSDVDLMVIGDVSLMEVVGISNREQWPPLLHDTVYAFHSGRSL